MHAQFDPNEKISKIRPTKFTRFLPHLSSHRSLFSDVASTLLSIRKRQKIKYPWSSNDKWFNIVNVVTPIKSTIFKYITWVFKLSRQSFKFQPTTKNREVFQFVVELNLDDEKVYIIYIYISIINRWGFFFSFNITRNNTY